MKWKKEIEEELFCQAEILEKNTQKIKKNLNFNSAYIIFPYNQRDLLIPDFEFWHNITKKMGKADLIICSPNALVKNQPQIPENQYLITMNEMTLKYLREIKIYLNISSIKNVIIVSSDIHLPRIKRDLAIIFDETEFNLKLETIVTSGFWKKIYTIREKMVLLLPMWLYQFLGSRR